MELHTLDAESGISLALEKLTDLNYLLDEMTVDFFEKYDTDTEYGQNSILWEFHIYASMMRLINICYQDIIQVLNDTDATKCYSTAAVSS